MSASIFVSYRREDGSSEAGRIASTLRDNFGGDSVFMDISSIQAGDEWPKEIQEVLKQVEFVIVVIGPKWLRAANAWGQRRIDDENDWVRKEIVYALQENKRIVPLLVQGAIMPPPQALPECLRALPERQAIEIRNDYWDHDIQLLLKSIADATNEQPKTRKLDFIVMYKSGDAVRSGIVNLNVEGNHTLRDVSKVILLAAKREYGVPEDAKVDDFRPIAYEGHRWLDYDESIFQIRKNETSIALVSPAILPESHRDSAILFMPLIQRALGKQRGHAGNA